MNKLKSTILLLLFLLCAASGTWAQQIPAPSIQWQGVYGGFQNEIGYAVRQTIDGGYIFGGYSGSDSSGNKTTKAFNTTNVNDYWVVKTDAKGAIQWQKEYGGTKADVLYEIELTKDSGYILLGTSASSITGNKTDTNRAGSAASTTDIWIIKIDDTGAIQWQKTLGGTGGESLNSYANNNIHQTFDGGYIVGCTSASGKNGDKTDTLKGTTSADIWILKLDANGAIQWQKDIGANGADAIASIRQMADSGYLVCGNVGNVAVGGRNVATGDQTDTGRGSTDAWLFRIDKNGTKLWDRTLGGSALDYGTDAWATEDGGYILGSMSGSGKTGDKTDTAYSSVYENWIVKMDANRNIQWQKHIGSKSNCNTYAFMLMPNGHYFLDVSCVQSGNTAQARANAKSFDRTDTGKASYDTWIMELDTVGNIIWQKVIGATKAGAYATCYNQLFYPAFTSDGGIILSGYSNGDSTGDKTIPPILTNGSSSPAYDFWVVKLGVNLTTHTDSICRYGFDTLHSGMVVNTAGTYRDTVFKSGAIDSVFVTNLSIVQVDTAVSVSGLTLTAHATNATFQWMYCSTNQPVPAATNASFTPVADGDYKLLVMQNGCVDTSGCHTIHGVGIAAVNAGNNKISVYPNPSNGVVHIVAGNNTTSMNIQVTNMLGNVLMNHVYTGNAATVDISSFAAGMYMIKVSGNDGYSVVKVTKTN